jgi:Protein of unknown function (DUF2971)
MDQESGFICLSKTWRNPLMWAHYANNHKGLCLGLSVNRADFEDVHYIKDRLTITGSDSEILEKLRNFPDLAKIKHVEWNYEREMRTFCRLDGCDEITVNGHRIHFAKLDDSMNLVEVFIGCRSEITSFEIGHLVPKSVKIQTVRPAFQSFSMTVQRSKSLKK